MSGTSTLNNVVGANVKRLRKRGIPWEKVTNDNGVYFRRLRKEHEYIRATGTDLAQFLSICLGREYTRYTVADIEGRRSRDIRWVELVALCAIFGVPLWDLVLPPEGVRVDVKDIPITGPESGGWVAEPDVKVLETPQPGLVDLGVFVLETEQPGRGDLAEVLFEIRPEYKSRREEAREEQRHKAVRQVADEVIQKFRESVHGALGIDEKGD